MFRYRRSHNSVMKGRAKDYWIRGYWRRWLIREKDNCSYGQSSSQGLETENINKHIKKLIFKTCIKFQKLFKNETIKLINIRKKSI